MGLQILDIVYALLGKEDGGLDSQAFIDILVRRDMMYSKDHAAGGAKVFLLSMYECMHVAAYSMRWNTLLMYEHLLTYKWCTDADIPELVSLGWCLLLAAYLGLATGSMHDKDTCYYFTPG